MNCAICGIRRPRRFCPAVRAEICAICCGTEREQSLDCPLECEFLVAAHRNEQLPELDLNALPNRELDVPESFLAANEWLLVLLASGAVDGARSSASVTDYDFRQAFESLIAAYRARQSGLYFEPGIPNPYSASIFAGVQARIADLDRREMEASGSVTPREAAILKLLIFLQRLEYGHNNGRARSRAFYDFLSRFFVPLREAETAEAEPRIIL